MALWACVPTTLVAANMSIILESSSGALHSARFPLGLGNDVRSSSFREEKAAQDDGGGCTLHFHCSQNRKAVEFCSAIPFTYQIPTRAAPSPLLQLEMSSGDVSLATGAVLVGSESVPAGTPIVCG